MKNKKLIVISFILVFVSCLNKETKSSNEFRNEWTVYKTKDSIPKPLKLVLEKSFKNGFKIADFDEEFNSTDIIDEKLPSKKILFLGKKNQLWRITYVTGGFGKYYSYIECKITKDSVYDFKIANSIKYKISNNKTIEKFLKDKDTKLTKIKIRYE